MQTRDSVMGGSGHAPPIRASPSQAPQRCLAELEGTNLEESTVIDHAIKTLSQSATVRVNIPARIYQVYGRQLTVEGADGRGTDGPATASSA
jgi:hypothetical protein